MVLREALEILNMMMIRILNVIMSMDNVFPLHYDDEEQDVISAKVGNRQTKLHENRH